MTASSTTQAARWPARRLRLKHHVFFRPTPEGVHFDAGSRHLMVPGPGVHRLVERVVGLMDQGVDLPGLQARLPERLQPAVLRLVQALDAEGLLLDETDATPWLDQARWPDGVTEFIKYLQDRADPHTRRQRWADWRSATVLLAGDGHALKAAARALADSGVGHLRVRLQPGTGPVDAAELRAHLQASGIEGQQVEVQAASPADEDFQHIGLALWASDGDDTAAAAGFERRARGFGTRAVLALRSGGKALVAPPSEPGLPGLHELLAWDDQDAGEPHGPASLALAGVVAAQAAMDLHFGIAATQWQRQVRRISPYLEVSRHALVAAGARPATLGPLQPLPADAFADLVGRPADRTLSAYEQQRIALAPWFDTVFGPFAWRAAAADGSLLAQLPLYHDAIAVRGPRGTAAPGPVLGWGLNAEQAGTRALLLALERLAGTVEPGRPATGTVAAFGTPRWQARALAAAVAGHPGFETRRRVAWLDLDDLHDPTVHQLRQLLRHFAPAAAHVLLHWHPTAPVCVAQVHLGDTLAASACDATALGAVQEALGLACSRLQVTDTAFWRGHGWAWPEPAPAQWQLPPADLSQAPAATAPRVRWVRAEGLNLPAGVCCGHAVLDSDEAPAWGLAHGARRVAP